MSNGRPEPTGDEDLDGPARMEAAEKAACAKAHAAPAKPIWAKAPSYRSPSTLHGPCGRGNPQ